MPGVKGMSERKPRPNTLRCKIWQSMRVKPVFTIPYLCITSGAKPDNVRKFIRKLSEHGYVAVDKKNKQGSAGSYKSWRLVKNIGPDYPTVCNRCGGNIGGPCIKEEQLWSTSKTAT